MKLVLFLKRQSWAAWLTGNSRVGGWLWERGLQRVKSPNKWGHIKILGNHLGIAQDNWHQKWRIGKPNCAFSKWRPLDSPILSYQKYINHFIYNYSVPYLPPPPPQNHHSHVCNEASNLFHSAVHPISGCHLSSTIWLTAFQKGCNTSLAMEHGTVLQ